MEGFDVALDEGTVELWREYRLLQLGMVTPDPYLEADAVRCDWFIQFAAAEAEVKRRAQQRADQEAEARRG